jgi:hypothetical protein
MRALRQSRRLAILFVNGNGKRAAVRVRRERTKVFL